MEHGPKALGMTYPSQTPTLRSRRHSGDVGLRLLLLRRVQVVRDDDGGRLGSIKKVALECT
jgi:hypothetical protein